MALIINKKNYRKYKTLADESEDNVLITDLESKGWILTEHLQHIDGHFLIFKPASKFIDIEASGISTFRMDDWLKDDIIPERNKRLFETDFLMLYDIRSTLTPTQLELLIKYRQELRDLPATLKTASEPKVSWPIKPSIPVINVRETEKKDVETIA